MAVKVFKGKRVSGVWPADTFEGKLALIRGKYMIVDGENVRPNYDAMRSDISAYLDKENTIHNPAGYRAALKNITANTLNNWLHGYVSGTDIDDENISPNDDLIDVMVWGRNLLIDRLYNQDSKYQSQLMIRTLEGMGELTPQKKIVDVNLSGLGSWEKWSK